MADDLQKHDYDKPFYMNIITDAQDPKDNSLMTTEFKDMHYTDLIYAFRQRNREMYCHYLSYEDERRVLQRAYLKSKKMLFSQKECLLCNQMKDNSAFGSFDNQRQSMGSGSNFLSANKKQTPSKSNRSRWNVPAKK